MPPSPPSAIQYRRWRAPREDGQTLIEPALDDLPSACAANVALRTQALADIGIGGTTLADLSTAARAELISLAHRHSSAYLDASQLPAVSSTAPILMAGHQPQLFHAGVWFKNFVLASVAARVGGTAINLLIDNDTCKSASLRMPTGPHDAPRLDSVSFDAPTTEIPYEARAIVEKNLFNSFAERTADALHGWIDDPLVTRLWPDAIAAAERSGNLGQSLAGARHRLEASLGLCTLEVPLSDLCHTRSFARFVLHLLVDLPRLQTIYNGVLADYRRVHRVRSRAHPVPDLAVAGSLCEAPLWIWSDNQPRRRPLFVERRADELVLFDSLPLPVGEGRGEGLQATEKSSSIEPTEINPHPASFLGHPLPQGEGLDRVTLPLTHGQITESTIDAWLAAGTAGLQLRRALLTTMYARLVLCDLFLHGIGGAKYDQLTDAIIQRFFGVTPPTYGIVTGTFRLPMGETIHDDGRRERLAHGLREFPFHPERYLDEHQLRDPEVAALVQEKQRLLSLDLPRGTRLARHQAITQANQRLAAHANDSKQQLVTDLHAAQAAQHRASILGSREFSFGLFPVSLCDRLLALAGLPAAQSRIDKFPAFVNTPGG